MKALSKALIVATPALFLAACGTDEPAQTASVTTIQPVAAQPAPMRTVESERIYQRDLRK